MVVIILKHISAWAVSIWSSRVVSRSSGGGGGPYVLRKAIASRIKPRAETEPPPVPRALGCSILIDWLLGLRNTWIWLAADSNVLR